MSGWVAGAVAVGTIGGAVISSNAAEKAADTQAASAEYAAQLAYQQWQEQQEMMEPWMQAGETALNQLTPLVTDFTPFSETDWTQDPGYEFRLSEGLKALDRSAAARGGLISGAALKAAENYGQEAASQEYQNAFNRYYAEREAQLNPLQSLAGVGQTTAQTLGTAGTQYASTAGDLAQTAAAARASGYTSQANTLSSSLNSLANLAGYYTPSTTTYTSPYVSATNPLGLTPGQGL